MAYVLNSSTFHWVFSVKSLASKTLTTYARPWPDLLRSYAFLYLVWVLGWVTNTQTMKIFMSWAKIETFLTGNPPRHMDQRGGRRASAA